MNDLEERISSIRRQIESAQGKKARLEGQKEQLEEQKKKILAAFEDLGIKPKDAEAELEKLDASINQWLEESEGVVAEYEAG